MTYRSRPPTLERSHALAAAMASRRAKWPELQDEVALLGGGNEHARGHPAARRVVPAHRAPRSRRSRRRELDDGLVVHREFARLQSLAQLLDQGEAVHRLLVHARSEEDVAALALRAWLRRAPRRRLG